MKIVYCIAGTYRSGGMERVLANKANWLVKQGHEVSVVTTDQRGRPSFFPMDARIRCYDLAVNYEENNGKSLFNKVWHYPYKQWIHRRRMKRLLRTLRADVTVSMFCNEATFLPKLNDGSSKVLEIHFSRFKRLQYGRRGLWKWVDRYRSWLDGKLVKQYNRFVVLTKEDAGYWGDVDNLEVIYNASPFAHVTPSDVDAPCALAVGRFTPQKGFDLLVEAWRQVDKRLPNWQLKIVGDGNPAERKALQQQIDVAGLTEKIHLMPPTPHIDEVYRSASMLVMTSRYEGLPMTLIEAQTFGLPIVSFACKCGPKDVITDGEDGYLVAQGDLDALANRIVLLANDDLLRKQLAAKAQQASRRFEEARIMQQWSQLFEKLVNKQKAQQ